MQVEAIEHKDVSGKSLYYLRITNGEHKVIVNIGVGTYNKVKELEKVQTLPLTDKTKQK